MQSQPRLYIVPYAVLCCAVQTGEVRSAIGSALVHLGVPPGAMVGLYSVNCPGGACGEERGVGEGGRETCLHKRPCFSVQW